MITTKDGTQLFYKDWGRGPAIVFSHAWPLSADAWDGQMMFLATRGFRCIAHDRRGHGRSMQSWGGNNIDTYADDLATLIIALELDRVVLVGHSFGAGDVVRYIARHGSSRVSKVVLLSGVLPFGRDKNRLRASSMQILDQIRRSILDDRSQYLVDLSAEFFGANRPRSRVSQGLRDWFWMQGMMGGLNALYECIEAFEAADFTKDLAVVDVPTLLIHGDDDQIVPIETSAVASQLLENSAFTVYPNSSHGLCWTNRDMLNEDLITFVKRGRATATG